jgi:hypothetical protein
MKKWGRGKAAWETSGAPGLGAVGPGEGAGRPPKWREPRAQPPVFFSFFSLKVWCAPHSTSSLEIECGHE